MEKHHLTRMALPKEYLMNSFKLIYKIFLVTACIATLGIVLAQTMQPPAMPGRMMVISESKYLSQMIPHHLEAIHTGSIIADRSP
jgi:hypothetical protein